MNTIHQIFADMRLMGDLMIFVLLSFGRNTLIEQIERALIEAGYTYQPIFGMLEDLKDER